MTELLLICAVGALGVAFATSVARWLLQRPSGGHELSRAASMVGGGVQSFLWRQSVVALSLAGAMGAAVFLAYGVAYQTEAVTAVSPREYGVWVTLSYFVGAGAAVVATWVAAWAGREAIARVAAGARRSLDDSLQIAIRAGAVSGVVAMALPALGLAGMFMAAFVYEGGLGADPSEAMARAPHIPMLLPGFALGAAFVALLSQLGGGIFGKVADVGADVVGQLEASLPEDAVRNPAAVADLVGDNLGDGAARASGLFASATIESLAALLVAALVYRHNDNLPSVTAIVLYPLVARTFGLLAAWFGVMVVRTDDTEEPMSAIARGLYVTTLLYAVGAVGCAKWLLGEHWVVFGACAVLGSTCSLLILYSAQYYSEQRFRPVRGLAEAARGGATLLTLRGLFTAVEGAMGLIVVTLIGSAGAYYLGAASDLAYGGLLGVAIAISGMLGSGPYVSAMSAMGSIVDAAGGIIEMTVAAERPDVRARAQLLDAVGTTVKSFSKSLVAVASSLACFLLMAVFLGEVWGRDAAADAQFDISSPSLYVGAILGLLVVLAFSWVLLGRIVGASRQLVNELRVQLGASDDASAPMPFAAGTLSRLASAEGARSADLGEDEYEGGGAGPGTSEATAARQRDDRSQLACVEIVSRAALRSMLPPALIGIGLPLVSGAVLRLLAAGDRVASSAEALVALLFVATIVTALGSLLFTNAGSAWDNAKKYIETGAHGGRYVLDAQQTSATAIQQLTSASASGQAAVGSSDNPAYVAAVVSDTIGDPLKGALGPAAIALVTTLAAMALVFLPFFL